MRENTVSCASCGNEIKINETKTCRCGWKYEGNKKEEFKIEEKPAAKPKRGKKRK